MAETDVAVIGAGQAGLSGASFLSRAGLDLMVLDRSPRRSRPPGRLRPLGRHHRGRPCGPYRRPAHTPARR
ncbi:FAD-dependent monooxygenase [Streptosporangium sp. NBC_01639]|uniref:FAD-dependent monooxygenase n=1 Tax=Streptosporangium sp. NBC_01639 TaxID=2975948 RepID=UPI003866A2E4